MSEIIENTSMPALALRGLTVFPGALLTFDAERPQSLAALSNASKFNNNIIFLVTQRDITVDIPQASDLFSVGTVCRIRQQLRQPKGNLCRVMVEGMYRARILNCDTSGSSIYADVEEYPDKTEKISDTRKQALIRSCLSLYDEYLHVNSEAVTEQLLNILAAPDLAYTLNYICQNASFAVEDKQALLEEIAPSKRVVLLNKLLSNEISILNIEKEINEKTQEQVNKNQREYYLREEMKAIQAELGEDAQFDDATVYRAKIEALDISDELKERLQKEVSRMAKQPFGSSESAVLRNYLDICLDMPWGVKTEETVNLEKARKILDDEHYGLEKVKQRIIEYLAVKKLSPEIKGGLICLVGPPGTGKTSIAQSVAHATNRKLVRVSLGGVRDEAEIRGHRKTYVGAMPGRIINGIIQAKSTNPLMVLDEIDKLGADYKGDPSAALLEALDPEQNSTFRDNFLEIPVDLSSVFFITTANTTDTIPRALLDRMEVIQLTSYTDEEKLQIAKKHLLPKQRKKHGLNGNNLRVPDAVLRMIISCYTKESGVRNLEREIASLCRKAAVIIASNPEQRVAVKADQLEQYLGPVKFKPDEIRKTDEVGLVKGLAYTSVGGEVLDVEVAVTEGSGVITVTGNLGDVMKESVKAATTFIRTVADKYGINPDFYKTKDIHIHFPEGPIPKDGPSAGITITVALMSALTGKKVRCDVAMTGEITLRGKVLAIGGLKEKTMGALRNGIKTVIIPADNLSDLDEIDQLVRAQLSFVPVAYAEEIFPFVLRDIKAESKNIVPMNKNAADGCKVCQ